jgi:dienelactone hydrolase
MPYKKYMRTGNNCFNQREKGLQTALVELSIILFLLIQVLFFQTVLGQGNKNLQDPSKGPMEQMMEQRTLAYKAQLEYYLQRWILEGYPERAEIAWNRDYSSIDAFERSVTSNREQWRAIINPPELRKTGSLIKEVHPYLKDIHAEWIELPLGPVTAQAILAFPEGASKNDPVPLVIAQHGIGSYPETPFEIDNEAYHAYARELLKAGFAVLAPLNLRAKENRNYIERLCRLIDTTLPGIELVRLQHLLDVVLTDPRIDPDRVGMWGVSLGGMATMFWMPLEPRIKAGVVSAWFNHRLNKMAIPDDRYVSFLVVDEEHAFFRGWLTAFSDHDVVSLICPRPLLFQHGKSDRIAHWPQVMEEFNIAQTHYEKLNIEDRIEMYLFEGGHEAGTESGILFLNRWLMP